jgi:hypothetical protein
MAVWRAGATASSSSTSSILGVQLDFPARLFLCVGCRIQVVLCSHCDRGNRYCGRACWRKVHDVARREAASRYQRSRRGRLQHAARSRRWRQRVADRANAAHKVTHQGSPTGVGAAPLAACTSDITSIATDPPARAPAPPPLRRCDRCAAMARSRGHPPRPAAAQPLRSSEWTAAKRSSKLMMHRSDIRERRDRP